MYTSFESLPDHTRLWIYQANRKFSVTETDIISNALSAFTEQWEVHGQPMKASFKIFYDQFILLAADEGFNAASGCSIDGSVRILKSLGEQTQIDFFDRNAVAFKINEDIILITLQELKQKAVDGIWNKDTIAFNNLVGTKSELTHSWLQPAGSMWLKRYLPKEVTTV